MPKYLVTVKQILTIIYETIEIDADDTQSAKDLAEEMAIETDLDEDSRDRKYETTVEEVKS